MNEVMRAVEAMYSLDQHARQLRDQRRKHRGEESAKMLGEEIDTIYHLKDRFLDAMVEAGKATVETFEVMTGRLTCGICRRDWVGNEFCRDCQSLSGKHEAKKCYLVKCEGGVVFRSFTVGEETKKGAVEIEAIEKFEQIGARCEMTVEEQYETVSGMIACLLSEIEE